MTAASFNQYIEEIDPITIRASHYDLAPDKYGLDDGYAWAFAEGKNGSAARKHLADGGDWPYYIAAKPNPASLDRYTAATAAENRDDVLTHRGSPVPYPGDVTRERGDTVNDALAERRVLETYCEGDLVAYVFESVEERDEAAERWQESREEFTARFLEDEYPHENAEALAPAVPDEASDGYGGSLDGDELADRIREVLKDGYAGEWQSLSDYVEEMEESCIPREARESIGSLWSYIDWERVAESWTDTHSTYPTPNGNVYVFRSI